MQESSEFTVAPRLARHRKGFLWLYEASRGLQYGKHRPLTLGVL